MGVLNDNMRHGASAAGAYEIDRSLRFNSGDTTKLERTIQSGGSTTTWTFSVWIKKCTFGATKPICGYYSADTNSQHPMRFNSSNQLEWYNYSSGYQGRLVTNRRFRDPSAWYHLVFVWDTTNGTAGDRMKIYVNGVEETSFATDSNPSSSQASHWNTNVVHAIGTTSNYNDGWFDGYMTEINFIDNAVKSASDFGKTDPITGAWIPKAYGGSYGTTGFYLNFSDNSNTTSGTLGADGAGSNDWTPTNFSVASGEGNDSVTDTPTNNYCTWNPIDYIWGGFNNYQADDRLRNGCLSTVNGSGKNAVMKGTFYVSSGKWYYECKGVGHGGDKIGWARSEDENGAEGTANDHTTNHAYLSGNGDFQSHAPTGTYGGTTYGGSIADGDVIGCAIDMDNNTVAWHNGGQWGDGSGNWDETYDNANKISISNDNWAPGYLDSSSSSGGDIHTNFGQQGFAHTPPTGFKALCTANMPVPEIKNGSDYFNIVTYTGNDSSDRDITGVGFQPDFLWIKNRDQADWHMLQDSQRGANKVVYSNETSVESTDNTNGHVNSFLADGFNVDAGASGNVNENSEDYVAWSWKESASAGFDIVLDNYSSSGSDETVSHGLGVTPEFILTKARDNDNSWRVYHKNMHVTAPQDYNLYLDLDNSRAQNSSRVKAVTSSNFTYQPNVTGNFVHYVFTGVEGYSKFDMYKPQGGTGDHGEFVWTGFRPRYVMIKRRDASGPWNIFDSEREPSNLMDKNLRAHGTDAEDTGRDIDFLSNGFKVRDSGTEINDNDDVYIYAAFAETSFKYANAR